MNIRRLPGLTPYRAALAMQEERQSRLLQDPAEDDTLFLLEHEPVYTIGSTPDRSSLHAPGLLPFPVAAIRRGGQATYHGPGQLVGYPIVNLDRRRRDLHVYVSALERALIAACDDWNVAARQREGLTGVWVGERKLASIGVGVRQWITMHGFAINIEPESLPPFGHITPCGIDGVVMTCLRHEGASCSLADFAESVACNLQRVLDESLPVVRS